jgi:para-aminobenzoate synthetase/4-amino-4-deoxychorismate lyase
MPIKPTLAAVGNGSPVTLRRVALDCSLAPAAVLQAVSDEPLPFALIGRWAGGGAIIGSDPLRVAADQDDPFAVLDDLPTLPEPASHPAGAVGGGWFGWLGYHLGARIEAVPPGPPRPVRLPDFHLAYYDNLLRLDPRGQWWFEALVSHDRRDALESRLAQLRVRLVRGADRRRPGSDGATQHRLPPPPPPLVLPADAAAHHLDAVARCRRRIVAGEIFQANICLRLEARWDGGAVELLTRALEQVRPPYAAAFRTTAGEIASLSPELFLRRRGSAVTTAPIKGTAERSDRPAAAAASLRRLRRSAKDAAEHVMIVDLMRNDLGRVCTYGSITAPREPTAEPHPGLWHLVSRLSGRLRPGVGDAELLRATFPPGSVTGAPKVQALKVIADLERDAREVYTGAIGFVSPVAGLELSVAIRTLEMRAGHLWLGAGGGIVADSDPRRELDEAIAKARPVAAAVGTTVAVDDRAPARSRRVRARRVA